MYKNKRNKELSVQLDKPIVSKVSWNLNSGTDSNTCDILPVIQGVSVPRFFDVVSFVSEISCVVPGCPNQAEH